MSRPASDSDALFWMTTVDRRRARLYRASRTDHGRLHLDGVATREEDWDDVQHGRPSPRAGKDGHSYASRNHEDEERLRRFGKAVAQWLREETQRRGIDAVHVFCGPPLLHWIRDELRDAGRYPEHTVDLGRLGPGELASHRAVASLAEQHA